MTLVGWIEVIADLGIVGIDVLLPLGGDYADQATINLDAAEYAMPLFLLFIGQVDEISGVVIGIGIWDPFREIGPVDAVAYIGQRRLIKAR